MPDKEVMYNYKGGKIFLNLSESRTMVNRILGTHEYWKIQLLKKIIQPNMTIVDIGACRGYYSLLSAKLMLDKGKIFSLEPEPSNCKWLLRSITANNYSSICVLQMAVSNKNGHTKLYKSNVSGRHSIIAKNTKRDSIEVKTIKLDTFIKKHNINEINIIKIDVEGADIEVLEGAREYLKKCNQTHILMDIHKVDRKKIFNLLTKYGFKIFRISRNMKQIDSMDCYNAKKIYAKKN